MVIRPQSSGQRQPNSVQVAGMGKIASGSPKARKIARIRAARTGSFLKRKTKTSNEDCVEFEMNRLAEYEQDHGKGMFGGALFS